MSCIYLCLLVLCLLGQFCLHADIPGDPNNKFKTNEFNQRGQYDPTQQQFNNQEYKPPIDRDLHQQQLQQRLQDDRLQKRPNPEDNQNYEFDTLQHHREEYMKKQFHEQEPEFHDAFAEQQRREIELAQRREAELAQRHTESLSSARMDLNQNFGSYLSSTSFEPPFIEVDGAGGSRVIPFWRASGVTTINTNFIRLTPDRQSKKGALWSRKPLAVPGMSAIFKFRISGQGKQFYGDGIALWITQDSYYTEGDLHGYKDKFRGIGIIFDTFKNTEAAHIHRDVTVIVNDGEQNWESMTESITGCNINVRYHADRADFSVEDVSKAKIILNNNNLELYIDARNSGEWQECVKIPNLPLSSDWLNTAHVGITATTGQLADNHDVISFSSYSDHQTLMIEEHKKDNKRLFEALPNEPIVDRLLRLEDSINYIFGKLDYTAHFLEHEFASIDDHIDTVTMKLKNREDAAETRIAEVEEAIKKQLDNSLNNRLSMLESQMKGSVDRKLNQLELGVDKKIKMNIIQPTSDATKAPVEAVCKCSSVPFILSIGVNVLACAWFYYIFNISKKKHLL